MQRKIIFVLLTLGYIGDGVDPQGQNLMDWTLYQT